MVEPGRYIPVDAADVVAILVFPNLAEGHTFPLEAAVIVPRKDLTRQTAGLDLYLPYLLEYFFCIHNSIGELRN